MAITLSPKPLVPAYPIQQDRQPDYPRALGPVFIGNPYRVVPEVKPPAGRADAAASAIGIRRSTPGAEAPKVHAKPIDGAEAGRNGVRSRAPGALLDLLA